MMTIFRLMAHYDLKISNDGLSVYGKDGKPILYVTMPLVSMVMSRGDLTTTLLSSASQAANGDRHVEISEIDPAALDARLSQIHGAWAESISQDSNSIQPNTSQDT